MPSRILFIGGNFYPEPTGIGKYNAEMTEWLAENGYSCSVITTYPYYPEWKLQSPFKHHYWYKKQIKEVVTTDKKVNSITIYRCPHYIPSTPSGKKRVLHDFSFFLSAFFKIIILLFSKKFDLVIHVTPSLPPGILAIIYKKIRGAKFICHIQDLQVDAANNLNMIRSKSLIKMLFRFEKYILENADIISSISTGMIKKIETKTDKPIIFFPNWSNVEVFYPIADKNKLKKAFGVDEKATVVLYSGAIGEKQGIQIILQAAKTFEHLSFLQFIICSIGPYYIELKKMAHDMRLTNVYFMTLQSSEKLNEFLNMADMHLVIQKAGTEDLVMPSKLANILSVGGLAIITANRGSVLHDMVSTYDIGLLCPAEDATALKICIERGLKNDNSSILFNARKYAEKYLSINKIMGNYIKDINI